MQSSQSSVDQTDAISNALARALQVDREARKKKEEERWARREGMEGIKIRNALIQHAPKFDGLQPLDPWL